MNCNRENGGSLSSIYCLLAENQPHKISICNPVSQFSFWEKYELPYSTATQKLLVICNLLVTLPSLVDIAPCFVFSQF